MLDRARIVDENFIKFIKEGSLPKPHSTTTLESAQLSKKDAIDLLDSQIKSRLLDIHARRLKEDNLSYYTIGSSGHEGNAVLGMVFPYTDMAFLHYRSGAFFIQRAKQIPSLDPIYDLLLSFVASSECPISAGRHKVLGSVALNIPPQTSTIASHLPKALGAALSITRAKELGTVANLESDSVILCNFGDASANHASAQTTFNAAQWIAQSNYPLPLVFICEDNGIGISVNTPNDWIEKSFQDRWGIRYIAADGLNIADLYLRAKQAQYYSRIKREAVFLHVKCVRLLGHAGSDIESIYRTQQDIEHSEFNDPLLHTARLLIDDNCLTSDELIKLYQSIDKEISLKSKEVIKRPKLVNAEQVMSSILPNACNQQTIHYLTANESSRKKIFGSVYRQLSIPRNLCQNINFALTDIMAQYPNTLVFGEDVGKKGGVYRVTADLQSRFGQRRVFDTLLDETTILGTAIGLSHNGFVPIPEIQFLAYLHNAEDQLRGEAATLSFFSNGQYSNPMVIRIASLAYQKGFGGHFHNDNSIAVLRDIPGIMIACPSHGADAARMLRYCVKLAHEEGRVVVFLEPIALYMTKDLHQAGDNAWLHQYPEPKESIEWGELGVYGEGDTVILTYANGLYLSLQAQKILKEKHQCEVKVVDIRWLAPLAKEAIIAQLMQAKRVLIVDEGRKSGSISEALITLIYESLSKLPQILRYTGEDSFIPLGNAWEYLLPSKEGIVERVLSMNNLGVDKSGRFSIS